MELVQLANFEGGHYGDSSDEHGMGYGCGWSDWFVLSCYQSLRLTLLQVAQHADWQVGYADDFAGFFGCDLGVEAEDGIIDEHIA